MKLKSIIFLILIIIIIILLNKDKINFKENFKNVLNLEYDIIKIDELKYKLLNVIKKNNEEMNKIKNYLINIYGEIKENNELRNKLLMLNLINTQGKPINFDVFENKNNDEILLNEIKIYLITIGEDQLKEIEKKLSKL